MLCVCNCLLRANECGEQPRGIAVAARSGVVLRVGEHHRRTRLATLHRALDCIVGSMQVERAVAFGIRDRTVQPHDRLSVVGCLRPPWLAVPPLPARLEADGGDEVLKLRCCHWRVQD